MSVVLKGLGEFDASVQGWFKAVSGAFAEAAQGLAKETLNIVLEESPQFSGDFTANWKVSVGAPDTSFTIGVIRPRVAQYPDSDGLLNVVPFKRGDREAIDYAKRHAAWETIKLGQHIFLSNSANHDENYAWKIEDGSIKFRSVNSGAEAVARRSARMVLAKYASIGASELATLRSKAK